MRSLNVTQNSISLCTLDLRAAEALTVVLDATPDQPGAGHLLVLGTTTDADGTRVNEKWLDHDLPVGATLLLSFGAPGPFATPVKRQRTDSPEHLADLRRLEELRVAMDSGELAPRSIPLPVTTRTLTVRFETRLACQATATDALPILGLNLLWHATRPDTYSVRVTSSPQGWPARSADRRTWLQEAPAVTQALELQLT